MEMMMSSQQTEKPLRPEPCSCLKYPIYSVVGEANDAWSQLSSLEIFQSKNETPTVELIDVENPCGQPSKTCQVTFHDAEDLDKYLANSPTTDRIRFM